MRRSTMSALLISLLTACAADAAPLEVDLVVEEAGASSPVSAGTPCTLRMQPAWRSGVNCQLVLRCVSPGASAGASPGGEGEDLFGGRRIGGYAVCDTAEHAFTRAFDGEHVRDGDPAIDVDLASGTVSWRGPNVNETATLRFTGEPRPIEPWDEAAR